jgi:hypothetical protein
MTIYGEKKIKSRYLAERSFLYFKYPSEEERAYEFYLPMLENIEISESQRPNYAVYDLVGRSGNLFAYTGSKSREMVLKFNITLPNVADYLTTMGISEMFSNKFRGFVKKKQEEKEKFTRTKEFGSTMGFSHYAKEKQKFAVLALQDQVIIDETKRLGSSQESTDDLLVLSQFKKSIDYYYNKNLPIDYDRVNNTEIVDYVLLWINVIRSSVINNSSKTNLGPPTVYINHGTMYNNIPCVCTSVSIRLVNQFGYDLVSLTPRQIEVTMNLSENRTGNFKDFEPFKYLESQNLAGWESVIYFNTMDPHS